MNNRIENVKKMSKEKLEEILNEKNTSDSDIIITSIELGHKEIEDKNYYTTEEVLKSIFEKNQVVTKS